MSAILVPLTDPRLVLLTLFQQKLNVSDAFGWLDDWFGGGTGTWANLVNTSQSLNATPYPDLDTVTYTGTGSGIGTITKTGQSIALSTYPYLTVRVDSKTATSWQIQLWASGVLQYDTGAQTAVGIKTFNTALTVTIDEVRFLVNGAQNQNAVLDYIMFTKTLPLGLYDAVVNPTGVKLSTEWFDDKIVAPQITFRNRPYRPVVYGASARRVWHEAKVEVNTWMLHVSSDSFAKNAKKTEWNMQQEIRRILRQNRLNSRFTSTYGLSFIFPNADPTPMPSVEAHRRIFRTAFTVMLRWFDVSEI